MNSKRKRFEIGILLITALVVLVFLYVINGFDREHAWLYLISGMLVLYAGYEAIFPWEKKGARKKRRP